MAEVEVCPKCKGTNWVCENHPDKAWEKECSCGSGIPCECNQADEEPVNPAGWIDYVEH